MRAGRVRVNGRVASLGDCADPGRDVVTVDGSPLEGEGRVYWVLHKPRGVLTTARDPQGRTTVMDLLPEPLPRVFPVGRLDRDTEGLLLLTNDGDLAHVMLHPSFEVEREYRVTVRGRVTPAALRQLAVGVLLGEVRTAPARVENARFDPAARATTFSLTLIEGRKRQIRRALAALGHRVLRLVRVRTGPLQLGGLASGQARPLSAREVRGLRRLAARAAARADGAPPRR